MDTDMKCHGTVCRTCIQYCDINNDDFSDKSKTYCSTYIDNLCLQRQTYRTTPLRTNSLKTVRGASPATPIEIDFSSSEDFRQIL